LNKHHIIKMSANTSSNLELLSEKNTQTINKKSTVKHKDFNYNDFFQKIPAHLSMSEKVRLTCELYENNYFIGKELKELDDIEAYIKPLKAVPANFSSKTVDYFTQVTCLHKKLSWVMKRIDDDFCKNFKDTFTTKTQLKEVQALAATVYANNCEEFCKNKVNSFLIEENGKKKITKRRRNSEENGDENKEPSNDEDSSFNLNYELFKESLKNKCLQSAKEFENLQSLKSKDLNQILSTSTPSIDFAKQVFGVTDTSQLPVQKKQAINHMAFLLDFVADLSDKQDK
jgi:hypothetical protein